MSEQSSDATPSPNGGIFPLEVSDEGFKYLFYGGLLVYVSSHLVLARNWSWENKLFPLLVGIPMIGLILLNVVFVRYPSLRDQLTPNTEETASKMNEALSSSTNEAQTRAERQKSEFGIVLWTIALPIAVYLLGFAYALPTYVFLFVMYYTRNLKKAVVGTAAFTAFSYVVFLVLLNLRVYHGVLELPNILRYLPT